MHVLNVRNVNDALAKGLHFITSSIAKGDASTCDSRNGPVYRVDMPVTTVYSAPMERVLFSPERDANPFFHIMESMWMLAGRNDVDFVSRFVKRMKTFSDDQETFHGAYGYRWRKWFGFDQLSWAIKSLKEDPKSRRVVISMWSPVGDAIPIQNTFTGEDRGGAKSKDLPCNDMIKFSIVKGALDMIVFNRSNDMIWGAYGANAVHMSFLQEFIALGVGIPVGRYYQISSDFHSYQDTFDPLYGKMLGDCGINPYVMGDVRPFPIGKGASLEAFEEDLFTFFEGDPHFSTPFFNNVIDPIMRAHIAHTEGDTNYAIGVCNDIWAEDWKMACSEWLQRRLK